MKYDSATLISFSNENAINKIVTIFNEETNLNYDSKDNMINLNKIIDYHFENKVTNKFIKHIYNTYKDISIIINERFNYLNEPQMDEIVVPIIVEKEFENNNFINEQNPTQIINSKKKSQYRRTKWQKNNGSNKRDIRVWWFEKKTI